MNPIFCSSISRPVACKVAEWLPRARCKTSAVDRARQPGAPTHLIQRIVSAKLPEMVDDEQRHPATRVPRPVTRSREGAAFRCSGTGGIAFQGSLASGGPAYGDQELVFCTTLGRPLIKGNAYRSFLRVLNRACLPVARFHELRHTAATLLLLQGVHTKIVSEMLGQASISITLDTYSHVLPSMQREAVRQLDALLSNGE